MPEPVATTTAAPAVAAPATPPITKTPTAEELAAAISGQPATTTPAAPKYRYEVAPNVVYQGDDLEAVVDQMVKAQKSANEHIQTLQTENRQFRTAQQPRDDAGRFAPVAPVAGGDKFDQQKYFNLLTEDPMQAANYLDGYRFGIPSEQVVPTFNRTVQSATTAADNLLVTSFFTQCKNFPFQDEAAMKELVEMVDQMGGVYTPVAMEAAHNLCLARGKYQPIELSDVPDTTPGQRPTPMPVAPQSGAHEPAQDYMAMAERMTPAQIREAIAKLEASGVK